MGKQPIPPVIAQARALLYLLENSSDSELSQHSDAFLTYFRDLHDHNAILKSTSPRFSGTTFVILDDILYRLESDPDAAFQSGDDRELMANILSDIVLGRIVIRTKPST